MLSSRFPSQFPGSDAAYFVQILCSEPIDMTRSADAHVLADELRRVASMNAPTTNGIGSATSLDAMRMNGFNSMAQPWRAPPPTRSRSQCSLYGDRVRRDDNEDEHIKALALHTVEAGKFDWDVI